MLWINVAYFSTQFCSVRRWPRHWNVIRAVPNVRNRAALVTFGELELNCGIGAQFIFAHLIDSRTCCFNYLRKRSDPPQHRPTTERPTPTELDDTQPDTGGGNESAGSPTVIQLTKSEIVQLKHLLKILQYNLVPPPSPNHLPIWLLDAQSRQPQERHIGGHSNLVDATQMDPHTKCYTVDRKHFCVDIHNAVKWSEF